MKLGFVTCVRLGLDCLDELCALGADFSLAVTLNDELGQRKSGRVYLDEFCRSRAISLMKVRNINDADCVESLRAAQLDWLFVIGWSQIAGPKVLASPKHGVLGIHPTLLPQGRGRAPIPWAILKGLPETGVTLFKLDEGVDSGPIARQHRLALAPDEDATSLYDRVCQAHRLVLRAAFPQLAAGTLSFREQDDRAVSYWPGRTPADAEIVRSMRAAEVDRLVRATTRPYPGAFWVADGHRIRVWKGAVATSPLAPGDTGICLSDGCYKATEFDVELTGQQ